MPRYFESTNVFNFSWDQVAQGSWRKYPNPHSEHVLSVDTISREMKDGKLFSKRLISKVNNSARWSNRFVSPNKAIYLIEESIVDPTNKVLITYVRNLGFATVMSITEKVTYTESAEQTGSTLATRKTWIDSQIIGLRKVICAFGHDKCQKHFDDMIDGFNYVLSNMFPQENNLSTSTNK